MLSRWVAAGGVQQGKHHTAKGTPCQDSIAILQKNGVMAAALADGAGSASNSHIGSSIAVETVTWELVTDFEFLHDSPEQAVADYLSEMVSRALITYAEQQSISASSLSSTLLFVGIKEYDMIIGHLGDGVILSVQKQKPGVLSTPERGEFANQTYLTMSKEWKKHLRISVKTDTSLDALVLMSDGTADSFYLRKEGEVAPAATKLIDWYRDISSSEMDQIVRHNLREKIRKKTPDDTSLLIVQQKKHTSLELKSKPMDYVKEFLGVRRRDALTNSLKILNYMGSEMSVEDVAQKTELGVSTVYRHLSRLNDLGLFTAE
ncbi:MAG: ArsR family transcriptional regulator [Candidatus Lokiarchaeota archaeon]|nr:ArsR family transcriptional regulator [Candidatus Lokiarchaeota archaeon]